MSDVTLACRMCTQPFSNVRLPKVASRISTTQTTQTTQTTVTLQKKLQPNAHDSRLPEYVCGH
jgi:hypothetical protein